MKKSFLLLLFGCFTLFAAQAQPRDLTLFSCGDTTACISNTDQLLQNAKRSYKLQESYMYDNKFILEYKATDPNSAEVFKLRVVFLKRAKGEDLALERPGVVVYELQGITGKYLDLFPIWQKYIDNSADLEAIADSGRSGCVKFDNGNGAGESYELKKDKQDKSKWIFDRNSWYSSVRI